MGSKNIDFPMVFHWFSDPHLARARRKCTYSGPQYGKQRYRFSIGFSMAWRPALSVGSQKMHLEGASIWEATVLISHWFFNGLATRTWRGLAENAPRVGPSMGTKILIYLWFCIGLANAFGAASQKMYLEGASIWGAKLLILHWFFNGLATRTWRGHAERGPQYGKQKY